jgi:hypothetical protein
METVKSVKEMINDIENKEKEEPTTKRSEKDVLKEKLRVKNASYYEKNKDKIKARSKEIVTCELCLKKIKRGTLNVHTNNSQCKKGQERRKILNSINNTTS